MHPSGCRPLRRAHAAGSFYRDHITVPARRDREPRYCGRAFASTVFRIKRARFRRHPLRALADRLPPYRRRAHGAVQLALRAQARRHGCCCASRTPTASARPTAAIDAIIDGLTLARPRAGTATSSTSSRAPRGIARRPRACSRRAAPITATPRPQELEEMREEARARGPPAALRRPLARPRSGRGARRASKPVIRLRAPQDGRDRRRRQGAGHASPGPTRTSTTSCCCAPTARRPTCWPSWSTTTTWA